MGRYFLHLRDGTDEILDPEGVEYPDMDRVRKAVLDGARGVMGNDIMSDGLMDLRYRIDAENETGSVVYSLTFKDAVNVIPC